MTRGSLNDTLQAALAHHRAGRLADAEMLYRQILVQQPEQPDTLQLLGVLRGQAGNPAEAATLIRRAIAAAPVPQPAWWSNLGKFLTDARDLDAAEDACRRAVELKPDFAEAHVNLGNVLRLAGSGAGAAAEYRYALRLNPSAALVHKLLGATLLAIGRDHLAESIAALREALRLNPADADAGNFLGVALRAAGDNPGAAAAFRAAVRPGKDFPVAMNNLGNALQAMGELDEAAACYRAAVETNPHFAEAHNNLASVLKEQGEVDASVDEYRQAVQLQPANAAMHSNLLLAMNYQGVSTRQSLFAAARAWADAHAKPLAHEIAPHANPREPGRRLRIGYVSADFREHASAFFLLPLLENHDGTRVEVFCYSDAARPDAITARCRTAAHHWRDIAGMPDARVADLVRTDAVDILVDLKLHADQNRLLVFARRPAPVQVTWLGYPGTTGLDAIDYRLSDPHLDSPADEQFYAEKTLRLPHTFWCYDPLSPEPVSPLPSLAGTPFTFGCLNHLSKIGAPLIGLWCRILAAGPASRLLLLAQPGSHRARILDIFSRYGVDKTRIEFVTPRPRAEYLRLYHAIDLALDSWPVNGHTTTFDSLWMGVPVLTLGGPTALGRAGISQLQNLALPSLIAADEDDYVNLATRLAGDPQSLQRLRQELRPRMQASPLMRGQDFAHAMEDAFQTVWHNYCIS
ncbi:MAG TPA: tetratricopeptide repeat protein [Phycisphaerae bacterium]|nr:tetratricopeptide repeat protein [Phycisphaerae bacterium]